MKSEIKAYMQAATFGETGASAEFVFPESFKGFQGHFPGNPILPGVCLIQCALVLAEEFLGRALEVRMIKNAKFVTIVTPMQPVQVECTVSGGQVVGASFSSDGNRIASVKMVVADA